MSQTAEQGPLITFGQAVQNDTNPDAGPSAWYQGDMILDPRTKYTYQPGEPATAGQTWGWYTGGPVVLVDQAPSTASTTNIANAATPVAGTPLTLVSASGSGITIGCSVVNALTGVLVTGLLGIDVSAARTVTGTFTNGSPKITDSLPTMLGVQVGDRVTLTTSGTLPTPFATATTYYVNAIAAGELMLAATPGGPPISATSAGSGTQTLNVTATQSYYNGPMPSQPQVVFGQGGSGFGGGQGGPMTAWNPAWAIRRCIIFTNNGNDTSGTYTIAGFDEYGFPMTQTVTGPSTSTVTTTKAFKYIASVTPAGTINSTTLSVGTTDTYGLALRVDLQPYVQAFFNGAPQASGGATLVLTAADIQTATATSGDVRGTVSGSSITGNGSSRLTLVWYPQTDNMNSTVGLLGQPQF